MSAALTHYDSVRLAQTLEHICATGEFQGISAGGRYGLVAISWLVYLPWCAAGANADFAVRLTGVIFLALAAGAIYLLTTELFRSRIGGITAALLTVGTPFLIIPSTYGKEHSILVFLLAFAFWCTLRGHRSLAMLWPIVGALSFVVAVTVREAALFALPAFILVVLGIDVGRDGERWHLRLGGQWLPGIITLIIAGGAVVFAFFGGQFIAVLGDERVTAFFWSQAFKFWFEFFVFTYFAWIAALIGVCAVWRLRRDVLVPLLLWFAMTLPIAALGGYVPRYYDVVLIPFSLFVAAAVAVLAQRSRLAAIGALLFLVLPPFWLGLPFLEARHAGSNVKQFAEYVATIIDEDDVVVAMDDSAFIEYYGHRHAMSVTPTSQNKQRIARKLIDLQRNGSEVYVLQSSWANPLNQGLKQFLQKNFDAELVGNHPLENYHDAERGFYIRHIAIVRLKGPLFNASLLEERALQGGATITKETTSADLGAWLRASLS